MNRVITDLMMLFRISYDTALKVRDLMDESGIDYSECTQREFNRTARECFKAFKQVAA